jgi:hypothetical protein
VLDIDIVPVDPLPKYPIPVNALFDESPLLLKLQSLIFIFAVNCDVLEKHIAFPFPFPFDPVVWH